MVFEDKIKELVKNHWNFDLWKEAYELYKAKWTTAYINDLPDEAFALILEGGEKDEEGKTTPRDLRKLPHHTEEVTDPNDDNSVDWTHLLNALARVNQVEGASSEEKAKAEEHLRSHYDRIKENEGE